MSGARQKSILDRMPGDAWQKFANLRAYYGFWWAHPGKSCCLWAASSRRGAEWNFDTSLDWHFYWKGWITGITACSGWCDRTTADRQQAPLYERDCFPDDFEWLVVDDHDNSVFAFALRFWEGNELIAISQFTPLPVPRYRYRIGISRAGDHREILNTDSHHYHGSNAGNQGRVSFRNGRQPWPRFLYQRDVAAIVDHLSAAGRRHDRADGLGPRRAAGRALRWRRHHFTLYSAHAERVELCLFDGQQREVRLPLPARSGDIWHGYLPGGRPGCNVTGYRVYGPFDPANGQRFQPQQAGARSGRARGGRAGGGPPTCMAVTSSRTRTTAPS